MTEYFQNTLFTGDNLYILHGMNSESVDLIYLDPPFNSKRTYSAPIGSKAAGVSFKDMWTWADVDEYYLEKLAEKHPYLVRYIESISGLHSKAMMAYITYITQRVIELHRVLKSTGSFYLHCDPTASHYLKHILDYIFGKNRFKNEIIWSYQTGGISKKWFGRKHDVILFYAKSEDCFINLEEVKEKRTDEVLRRLSTGNESATRARDEMRLPNDVWNIQALNAMAKERTGYPTQKPLALLDKIIKASSKAGDLVLDPFCGCATTCVAAEHLGRKWIGIDIEKEAATLVMERLKDAEGHLFTKFINLLIPPKRTDIIEEPITPETKTDIKNRLFNQQNGHCNGCNIELPVHQFEIDHVVPKAKGGGDYFENYQLLCPSCNRIKGARPMDYLRMKIKVREELMRDKIQFGE